MTKGLRADREARAETAVWVALAAAVPAVMPSVFSLERTRFGATQTVQFIFLVPPEREASAPAIAGPMEPASLFLANRSLRFFKIISLP